MLFTVLSGPWFTSTVTVSVSATLFYLGEFIDGTVTVSESGNSLASFHIHFGEGEYVKTETASEAFKASPGLITVSIAYTHSIPGEGSSSYSFDLSAVQDKADGRTEDQREWLTVDTLIGIAIVGLLSLSFLVPKDRAFKPRLKKVNAAIQAQYDFTESQALTREMDHAGNSGEKANLKCLDCGAVYRYQIQPNQTVVTCQNCGHSVPVSAAKGVPVESRRAEAITTTRPGPDEGLRRGLTSDGHSFESKEPEESYEQNIDKTEKALRKAVELNPNNAVAWNNLGVLLYDMKKYDEAEKAFRKARELGHV
jgi:DNA-directed RNA polymerase subunit RPC12/RpoP